MERLSQARIMGPPSAPIGVIDIGSNSVRMVVYEGERRSPHILFNEKVLCGLGKDLNTTGRLSTKGVELALQTLGRFAHLAADMNLKHLDCVATSAVRDALDGLAFAQDVEALTGLQIDVLSGQQEALYTAKGVLSGTPEAEGIVGDLGGGSLELGLLKNGEIIKTKTLPIGLIRLIGNDALNAEERAQYVKALLSSVDWLKQGAGLDLYLVGGAWRTLARVEMQRCTYPIPVVHHFIFRKEAVEQACIWTKDLQTDAADVASRRLPTLPLAAELLHILMEETEAKEAVVSAMGLREGLLYERLSSDVRRRDPFIDACEEMARRLSRFPEHGNLLMSWIDPLFGAGETAMDRKTRYGICLTSDIGWRAHPDYRAESALYSSLYGWFVGVDARARAMMGLGLFTCYGGARDHRLAQPPLSILSKKDARKSLAIGQALRLAQRLSGGTAQPLSKTRLFQDEGKLKLAVLASDAALAGEVVERRLRDLAATLDLKPEIQFLDALPML